MSASTGKSSSRRSKSRVAVKYWRTASKYHRVASTVLYMGVSPASGKLLGNMPRFPNRRLLPNDFPEACDTPKSNNVDATLRDCDPGRQSFTATRAFHFLEVLFPHLDHICDSPVRFC